MCTEVQLTMLNRSRKEGGGLSEGLPGHHSPSSDSKWVFSATLSVIRSSKNSGGSPSPHHQVNCSEAQKWTVYGVDQRRRRYTSICCSLETHSVGHSLSHIIPNCSKENNHRGVNFSSSSCSDDLLTPTQVPMLSTCDYLDLTNTTTLASSVIYLGQGSPSVDAGNVISWLKTLQRSPIPPTINLLLWLQTDDRPHLPHDIPPCSLSSHWLCFS